MGFSLCVQTFGAEPVTCSARPLLFQAHADLERGRYVEAGCRLREAIRLILLADCQYHDIPVGKKQKSPTELAKLLKKAGQLKADHFQWFIEAIGIGNKAAHLCYVRPSLIACCLDLMHAALDGTPHLVEPQAAGRLV